MTRDNYYILLDLDPNTQDPKDIEAAIKKKKLEWSRMRNNSNKSTLAKKLLDEINSIQELMKDEEKRKKEAEQARIILLQKQKEQFKELDQALRMISVKGYVTKQSIQKLLKNKNFKGISIEMVEKRITVPIHEDAPNKKQQIKKLDSSKYKSIKSNLELLGHKDLYSFLELKPSTRRSTLLMQIEDWYKMHKKTVQTTAKATAKTQLLSICKEIFKSDDNRKMYDNMLGSEKFAELERSLNYAGFDKEIQPEEFEELLKLGGKLGLKKNEVISYIKEKCKERKWILHIPVTETKNALIECGICGILNPPQALNCSRCRFPLKINCPDCNTLNPSVNHACSNCGYSIGDMPNALRFIQEAKYALAEQKFEDAQRLFYIANNYWKNHPDILTGLKNIQQHKALYEQKTRQLQELINQKYFYKAKSVLQQIKSQATWNTAFNKMESRVEEKLKETESLLTKARFARGFTREQLLTKALQICEDAEEARKGLEETPPEAPESLTAIIGKNHVSLKWKPVPSTTEVKYRVLRKSGSPSHHEKDGHLLGDVPLAGFNDTSILPGDSCYYTVFTIKGGLFSRSGAISKLVTKTAEVESLEALPGDQQIHLKWKPLGKVERIEVWMKKGKVPPRFKEGIRISAVKENAAFCGNLLNDQHYSFRIVPIYKSLSGKELLPEGMTITAKPIATPQPVKELQISKKESMLEIAWLSPNDQIELFCCEKKPSLKFGESLLYNKLSVIGKSIPIFQKGRAGYRLKRHGKFFLVPVTIKDHLAVIGKAHPVFNFKPVSNFKGYLKDGNIRLQWTFPEGVEKVLVVYYEKGNELGEKQQLVHKKDYPAKGILLENVEPSWLEIEVIVKTIIEDGKEIAYSEGVKAFIPLKKTALTLAVKKSNSISRILGSKKYRFNIEVQLDGELSIPLLLVVKENNRLISSKDVKRQLIDELDKSKFLDGLYNTQFSYHRTNGKVKNLFFSLIPKHLKDKGKVLVKNNGLKVYL
jgi:hypothetical protein